MVSKRMLVLSLGAGVDVTESYRQGCSHACDRKDCEVPFGCVCQVSKPCVTFDACDNQDAGPNGCELFYPGAYWHLGESFGRRWAQVQSVTRCQEHCFSFGMLPASLVRFHVNLFLLPAAHRLESIHLFCPRDKAIDAEMP